MAEILDFNRELERDLNGDSETINLLDFVNTKDDQQQNSDDMAAQDFTFAATAGAPPEANPESITVGDLEPEPSNFVERVIDSIPEVADKVSSAPGFLRDKADQLNEFLADAARRVKKDTTRKVEGNLIRDTARSFGGKVGSFLSQGNNLLWTIAGVVILILIIRK